MAMLPESVRTAASYLGGGVARAMETKGGKVAEVGQELASAINKPVIQKVGNFLESVGTQIQRTGASAGKMGGVKKRDMGLAASGVAMAGAFVGGMGANAGANAIISHLSQAQRYQMNPDVPEIKGNVLPANLQEGYISLNTYGSPLGRMNIMTYPGIKDAQIRQRYLRAAIGPEFVPSSDNNE